MKIKDIKVSQFSLETDEITKEKYEYENLIKINRKIKSTRHDIIRLSR